MKITACSIVKNEANNITRSMESYKNAVDEIIIVDTGSDDNTVELCRQCGAVVLFYPWNNDFSSAKNYALEHATGDWIIFLDADEWFVPTLSKIELTDILKGVDTATDALMTTMCQHNIKTGKILSKNPTIRIFRNAENIRYSGSIHERLMKDGSAIGYSSCVDFEIYHSGYDNDIIDVKAKRNLDILYDIYKKGEANTSIYFYIFRENYILGNNEETEKFYKLFMRQEDADRIIQEDTAMICTYEFMYRIMVSKPEKYSQEEINALLHEAYSKYPELPMHSYLIGCEMIKSDYSGSYRWLENAIKTNISYSEHFTNSFIACVADTYYKLGYISQEQGFFERAMEFYVKAIENANINDMIVILPKLIKIIETSPENEIILFLKSIIDTNKKENIKSILESLKKTKLYKVFIYFAVIYNQKFDEQDENTYIAMMLSGQTELAVETAIVAWKNAGNRLSEDTAERVNSEDGRWHLDYAVIGILYGKRLDLYDRFEVYFSLEQREIIGTYLKGNRITNVKNNLVDEYKKINNRLSFMLDKDDLIRFETLLCIY